MSESIAKRFLRGVSRDPMILRGAAKHLEAEINECDVVLRTSTDHQILLRAQGKREGLQELLDYVDNGEAPPKQTEGKSF